MAVLAPWAIDAPPWRESVRMSQHPTAVAITLTWILAIRPAMC
jgi:hypothetical protein